MIRSLRTKSVLYRLITLVSAVAATGCVNAPSHRASEVSASASAPAESLAPRVVAQALRLRAAIVKVGLQVGGSGGRAELNGPVEHTASETRATSWPWLARSRRPLARTPANPAWAQGRHRRAPVDIIRAMATHSYRYLTASGITADGRLGLATSGGRTAARAVAHPRFYAGFLTRPELAATGLLAVANVARARYYNPQVAAGRDPVVTCDGDRLRFESFSGCCGVYARLDLLSEALDGGMVDRGTTNVDVNPALREALAKVAASDLLHLSVGADDLAVTTVDGAVVEKKVPLPERWLRGFAEVPVVSASFDPRAELSTGEASQFLRALPTGRSDVLWAVPAGKGLRLSTRPVPGAVSLAGPQRLEAMRPLLRFRPTLRAYGPPVGAGSLPVASAWELSLPGLRLVLALSPEPRRGFSGEGGVLDALATEDAQADADLIGALLTFEPRIELDLLGERSGLGIARVRAALVQLGTGGRVGYDLAEAGYFHRELPYDAGRIEAMNPRLRNARALITAGAVRFDDGVAVVTVGDHSQRVRFDDAGAVGCTCQWWAEYRGTRGKCKHVLAAELARRGDLAEPEDAELEAATPGDTG